MGILNFEKKKSIKYLILAGINLGISFYAHKSMRSAAPVWTVMTILYLMFTYLKNWKLINIKNYFPVIIFITSIAPFYLVTPILEYKYSGAVFGNQDLTGTSVYDFAYFYLSSFDLSFLFVKGDQILHHSTLKHGMFLLSALPLFVYGIYQSVILKKKLLTFLVICFFSGPLLLGFVGSAHRASRMIFLVPLFSVIAAFGFYELLKFKDKIFKGFLLIFCLVFIINFYDFIKYYWFEYAQDTYHIFYNPISIPAYRKLYEVSEKENLKPLIDNSLLKTEGDAGAVEDFARSLYFVKPNGWNGEKEIPRGSVLLTNDKNFKNAQLIESSLDYYIIKKNY